MLIELYNDLPLNPTRLIIVDHHGERAGKEQPTALHQVFALLGLPPSRWSRWLELVAANDRGYIPALVEAGTMPAEIASIRAADRAAQGITAEPEGAAEQAIARSPDEVNFYGRGALVRRLARTFPGGWYGGALPAYGYWGHGAPFLL